MSKGMIMFNCDIAFLRDQQTPKDIISGSSSFRVAKPGALRRQKTVGWVERSDTHRALMGIGETPQPILHLQQACRNSVALRVLRIQILPL